MEFVTLDKIIFNTVQKIINRFCHVIEHANVIPACILRVTGYIDVDYHSIALCKCVPDYIVLLKEK